MMVLENLLRLFENPSMKFKKMTVTYLDSMFTMAYGIIHVEDISKWFKYLWTAYIVLSPTTRIFSIMGYCALSPVPLNFEDYVISLVCLLGASIPVFTLLSLKFYSHKVREVLNVMDEEVDTDFKEISIAEEGTTRKLCLSPFLRSFVLLYGLTPISLFGQLLGVLRQQNSYNTADMYFFPMPGLHKVDSQVLYAITYTIQYVLMIGSPISLFESLIFVDVLMTESDKEFRMLRDTIKANAETFRNRLKSVYEADLKNPDIRNKELLNRYRKQLDEEKGKICNNFSYNLILCIRCHQKLMKKVRTYMPVLEYIISFYVSALFFGVTLFGFVATKLHSLDALTPLYLTVVLILSSAGYHLHYIGDKFLEMNEMIVNEVYKISWYELPANIRKDVCIFLAQAHCTIQLYSIKIFPVSLEFVPRIANTIYSYILHLRTLQLLSKK